jgi:raffinose/stachyose/melibiose transport system substrate-binding protein
VKKFLQAVCLLLLVATVISGCAPAAPAAPTTAPAAAEPTKAAEPTAAAPAETATTAPAAAVTATAATTATTAPAAAKQNLTLTLMASQGWIKDAELELAKKFETQTGIHVDYQIIPADQYFNVLKTKLNSGEGTDIFAGQSGKSDLKVQYDVEKNAVDLTGEEWVKRQDPLATEMVSLNGKVYGQEIWDTIASNYFIINYNKTIFEKLGLSVPKTYAEFKAACDKIKAAGITPIYEPISDGWHHVLWFPMDGPRFEELEPGLAAKLNANTVKFADDKNMLTALQQLQELYTAGYFGDNAMSDTYADTNKQLASGKYAMSLTTLTTPVSIEKDYPDVKATTFGFFPIPLVDNQLAPGHPAGPSKFVYSGSKHITEAKQYLAFLAQPENLQYLLDNSPDFATLDYTGLKDKWTPEQKAFLNAYPAKTIVYQDAVNYVNPQWTDMGKDFVSMFNGSVKPEDVLKSIDQRRADMAKTAKDPAWPQ